MPWWTFRYLSDRDLADMYAYIRSLGPAGKPAHDWVPPGQDAPPPYLKLVLPPPPQVQPAEHWMRPRSNVRQPRQLRIAESGGAARVEVERAFQAAGEVCTQQS